jgi:acetyltransferase-like isoleucine patch superfamily enzyme
MPTNDVEIARSAFIDEQVSLDPGCVISHGVALFGRVEVAERARIEANTVVYGPARIGAGSFIGPSVTLGFPSKTQLADSMRQRQSLHNAANRAPLVTGRECIVRSGTCLYSDVEVGDFVSFGHNVMIRENVRIGGQTTIGTGVVIDGSCSVGKRVSIQTGGYLCTNCTIEDGVFLGPHAVLTNDKYVTQKETTLVGPKIRKGASIGANSLLMPGVEIGEASIVGAFSLVMNDVPPRSVYVGAPARKLKNVPADWRTSLLKP